MPRYDNQHDEWDAMVRRDQFIMCGLFFTGIIGTPLSLASLAYFFGLSIKILL
jgi:hypothetical protein